jgi:hypothetical protein
MNSNRIPSFNAIRASASLRWAEDIAALRAARVDLSAVVAVAIDPSVAGGAPVAFVCQQADALDRLLAIDPALASMASRAITHAPLAIASGRLRDGMLDLETTTLVPR